VGDLERGEYAVVVEPTKQDPVPVGELDGASDGVREPLWIPERLTVVTDSDEGPGASAGRSPTTLI
jgi:hypothetical protein